MRTACMLVLLVGLLALVPAGSGAVRAEDPGRIVIDITYVSYGWSEPAGSFSLSGAYEDSGSCIQTSFVINADGSFTSEHALTGSDGAITVRLDIDAAYHSWWFSARRLGTFTVLSGTGAYETLPDGGETLQTVRASGGWGIPGATYSQTVYHLDSDPPENVAPTASLMANPVNTPPYTYSLFASCWDEDGMPVRYEWDFDGNGIWDAVSGTTWVATHTYPGVGTYHPVVRVTDNDGATATATTQVVVAAPPTVTISSPTNASTVSGTVTFSASVTNAISVGLYVDGVLFGTASSSALVPWTGGVAWNTTTATDGTHTLTAIATSTSMLSASASIQVTVANGTPPPPPPTLVTVASISPNTMRAGKTIQVTVTGTGFQPGATLSFANGTGATPVASAVAITSTTRLTATVTVKKSGPKGSRVWDVVVRNPNGQSGTLPGSFTVTR